VPCYHPLAGKKLNRFVAERKRTGRILDSRDGSLSRDDAAPQKSRVRNSSKATDVVALQSRENLEGRPTAHHVSQPDWKLQERWRPLAPPTGGRVA